MDQTPLHFVPNDTLLTLMPQDLSYVIEVGCMAGVFAREYKIINPACMYMGIDIVSDYIDHAKLYCDKYLVANIEDLDPSFYDSNSNCDCWIFADVLEHLRDPWNVIKNIRRVIPANGYVLACIPNAQHWSVIAKLAIGDFRYVDSGLFDKTHLRWFTRQTIVELFTMNGFIIDEFRSRIFDDATKTDIYPLIGQLAKACGADPRMAQEDCIPFQYVVRVKPDPNFIK